MLVSYSVERFDCLDLDLYKMTQIRVGRKSESLIFYDTNKFQGCLNFLRILEPIAMISTSVLLSLTVLLMGK